MGRRKAVRLSYGQRALGAHMQPDDGLQMTVETWVFSYGSILGHSLTIYGGVTSGSVEIRRFK